AARARAISCRADTTKEAGRRVAVVDVPCLPVDRPANERAASTVNTATSTARIVTTVRPVTAATRRARVRAAWTLLSLCSAMATIYPTNLRIPSVLGAG